MLLEPGVEEHGGFIKNVGKIHRSCLAVRFSPSAAVQELETPMQKRGPMCQVEDKS